VGITLLCYDHLHKPSYTLYLDRHSLTDHLHLLCCLYLPITLNIISAYAHHKEYLHNPASFPA
jgi:hypothetical protein